MASYGEGEAVRVVLLSSVDAGTTWQPVESPVGGGGGGGTEYTEDAAAAANPLGPMFMAVRSDVAATSVSADGDVTHTIVDSEGRSWVRVGQVDGVVHVDDNGATLSIDDGAGSITIDTAQLPAALVGGRLDVNVGNTVAVTGPLTDAQLRATAVPVSGTVTASGPLTDAQLRAVAVPVSGTVSVSEPVTVDGTVTANAGAGPWPVTDNSGTLTVDAPVATPVNVQVGDGTRTATVRDTGTSDSLNVAIVDAAGGQITSFGGGTEYTEDAAAPADPVGAAVLVTRDDQLATVTEVEGDWSRLRGTAKGALWVAIPDSNGDPITSFGGGTQYTEDAAAAADPTGNQLMARRRDTPVSEVSADGDAVALNADKFGHLYVTSRHPPMYFYTIPSTVHVAAGSTLMWDIFNADASLVVRVLSIQHVANLETAVTGAGFEWQLLRTTAVGTGGTAQTAWLPDTSQTALDADITCRLKATGGATASTSLRWYYTHSEETQAGNQLAGGAFVGMDLVPLQLQATRHGIVLRQNQGLRLNQETNSAAGNSGWLIGFVVE